jgi:rubrerythrin
MININITQAKYVLGDEVMNSLEFAIKMELDGEKYYKEQAEINKENSLNTVFLLLAKDEAIHAEILKSKFNGTSYALTENDTLAESKNIFQGIGDFKNKIKCEPNQLDLYREALDKEKHSIDLYEKLLSEAVDENEKALYEYLIKQEKEHFVILEEFVLRVNRPDEWIESAEFGVRQDY